MITVEEFWANYLLQSDNQERELQVSMFGTEEDCDQLVDLIAQGKKTAGSSLLKDYQFAGEEPPSPGTVSLVVDSKGTPVCVIEIQKVYIANSKFKTFNQTIPVVKFVGNPPFTFQLNFFQSFFAYLHCIGKIY